MENIKIGITISLGSVNDSIWTNGLKLNILMFITLLNNSKKNYDVYLLNVDDIPMDGIPQHLKDANFGLLSEKYEELDLLITMGSQVKSTIFNHFKDNKNKKIITYKCGNNYVVTLENILFKDSPENYPLVENGIDEVWYVPQQHETNHGFYKTLYRCNAIPVPFIWDNTYIEDSMRDIESEHKKNGNKKSVIYDNTKKQKVIGVMEPNINVVKFGLIPSMIAEECYRGDIGKEYIESLMITNTVNISKHKDFMGIIKSFDLYKDKKLSGESRYKTPFVVSQYMDIVISHQVLNPLNYLYLDVAYMGYPILHNAPLCKDIGYYYEGGDTVMGAKTLEHILTTHDDNHIEYKIRNRKLIERYLVNNETLISTYDNLIHNLFNGGNNKNVKYCEKTNTIV